MNKLVDSTKIGCHPPLNIVRKSLKIHPHPFRRSIFSYLGAMKFSIGIETGVNIYTAGHSKLYNYTVKWGLPLFKVCKYLIAHSVFRSQNRCMLARLHLPRVSFAFSGYCHHTFQFLCLSDIKEWMSQCLVACSV